MVRVAIALWVLAALFCLTSLVLYWDYFTSRGRNAGALLKTEAEIDREIGELEALLDRLDAVDFEFQERENQALNQRIAQRVFSWSSLFDRVAEVLPNTVSLVRIAPKVKVLEASLDSGPRSQPGSTIVELGISGRARNDEALLQLIDRLFEHPSFTRPNLSSEKRLKGRELGFSMTVTFLPEVEAYPREAKAGDGSGPASVTEGSAGADRSDQLDGEQT